MIKELKNIAEKNNGFITTSDVTKYGLQRRELTYAVKNGELVHLTRGLYCTPQTWEDEYVIAQHRFACGIFSHDTALYLLEFSDSAPEVLTMSFPRGYNISAAKRSNILPKTSPAGLHTLGVISVDNMYGNRVVCYNIERTLCDMLRGVSNPDVQTINPAMRTYLFSSKRNISKLQSYAHKLGVEKKINSYLKVLL